MNVLILTVTYYPEQKSASFMLRTLAEELASLGNKVTVITFSSDIDHEFTNEIINGVELIRIKVGNPGYSRIKRALIELSYSWRIKSFLKNHIEHVSKLVLFVDRDLTIISIVLVLRKVSLNSGNLFELI